MVFSYSGLTTQAKVTLPSVEGWMTNNNILKDPPKSYYTRRRDYVGDSNEILNTMSQSRDRYCENILKYPRGRNIMVKVDYSNNGLNGGLGGAESRKGMASAPYRVYEDGAFRPPIIRQEQQLPLSRIPYSSVSAYTNKEINNYIKRAKCTDFAKVIKNKTNPEHVQTNVSYQKTLGIQEPTQQMKRVREKKVTYANVHSRYSFKPKDVNNKEINRYLESKLEPKQIYAPITIDKACNKNNTEIKLQRNNPIVEVNGNINYETYDTGIKNRDVKNRVQSVHARAYTNTNKVGKTFADRTDRKVNLGYRHNAKEGFHTSGTIPQKNKENLDYSKNLNNKYKKGISYLLKSNR